MKNVEEIKCFRHISRDFLVAILQRYCKEALNHQVKTHLQRGVMPTHAKPAHVYGTAPHEADARSPQIVVLGEKFQQIMEGLLLSGINVLLWMNFKPMAISKLFI